MFLEQLLCVRGCTRHWGTERSVRNVPRHLRAYDSSRREQQYAQWLPRVVGCSDRCMRTTERKVLEAEELELGESSSIGGDQRAVRFGWGIGKRVGLLMEGGDGSGPFRVSLQG